MEGRAHPAAGRARAADDVEDEEESLDEEGSSFEEMSDEEPPAKRPAQSIKPGSAHTSAPAPAGFAAVLSMGATKSVSALDIRDIETYPCSRCPLHFPDPDTLEQHMASHAKAFKCDFCSKRFRCASHLKRHIRMHTGERPYGCRHCPKQYTSMTSLLRHMIAAHRDYPYTCHICAATYVLERALRDHLQSVHKVQCKLANGHTRAMCTSIINSKIEAITASRAKHQQQQPQAQSSSDATAAPAPASHSSAGSSPNHHAPSPVGSAGRVSPAKATPTKPSPKHIDAPAAVKVEPGYSASAAAPNGMATLASMPALSAASSLPGPAGMAPGWMAMGSAAGVPALAPAAGSGSSVRSAPSSDPASAVSRALQQQISQQQQQISQQQMAAQQMAAQQMAMMAYMQAMGGSGMSPFMGAMAGMGGAPNMMAGMVPGMMSGATNPLQVAAMQQMYMQQMAMLQHMAMAAGAQPGFGSAGDLPPMMRPDGNLAMPQSSVPSTKISPTA
eukprot:m.227035 g.227035  ORF g.227035 m.227035 type:complete len:502 (+) comp11519_c0_seq1:137-1642(+)